MPSKNTLDDTIPARLGGSFVERTLAAARAAEYDYCRDNLLYFCNKYCVIEDKDADGLVVPFTAWAAQEAAILSIAEHRLNIILKARQIGMTWVALYIVIHDLIYNVGHTCVAISQKESYAYELVRRAGVILSEMEPLLAGGNLTYHPYRSEIRITRDGVSSILMSFPATESAARSFTANILLLDEWAFQKYAREIWQAAFPTINRPNGGKVIGVSTIKRGTLFEDMWCGENKLNKIFIPLTADPARDKDWYAATLDALGIDKMRREYPRTAEEALMSAGGLFFHEFDLERHVCAPFEIPADWEIYSVMDYGLDMLAYYKIAVDSAGTCYVFYELAESDLVIPAAAEKILEADRRLTEDGVKAWRIPSHRLAPPDLFAVSAETGVSQAAAFVANGVPPMIKVSNNLVTGYNAVKSLLRARQLPDGTVAPRLKVFSTCTYLIRCMQKLLVDDKNPNVAQKEPHDITHAPDALRYFAVWWIKPSELSEQKPKSPRRQVWTEDMISDYRAADAETKRNIESKYGLPPD